MHFRIDKSVQLPCHSQNAMVEPAHSLEGVMTGLLYLATIRYNNGMVRFLRAW